MEDKLDNIQSYTVIQACEILSVRKTKIYDLMGRNDLRYFTVGSRRRITHAEIARFQEANRRAA
jgi:excisionase family DNA binding protein